MRPFLDHIYYIYASMWMTYICTYMPVYVYASVLGDIDSATLKVSPNPRSPPPCHPPHSTPTLRICVYKHIVIDVYVYM